MFDVIISGGVIADGSGASTFRADVGIDGERIAEIGDLSESGARRVIDATGLTVSPGFIDTHAHSDGVLLLDPQHANGLRQGITTEILGQDGLSYAPMSADNYRVYRRYLSGILGEPPEDLDMSSRRGLQIALPPQGRHYHRVQRPPRRRSSGNRRFQGRPAARRRDEQSPRHSAAGHGGGRSRFRHRHVVPPQRLERHRRACRDMQGRRRIRRRLHDTSAKT